MDLVVAGTDAAVGGDHMTAVDPPHAVFGKQRHRTRMDPQAVAPRHVLQPGRPGAVGLARDMRAGPATVADEQHRHFGKEGHHRTARSEEHTSELQSLMRQSYAVLCLQKKKKK